MKRTAKGILSNQKGFSLTEVLVALSILTIIIFAYTELFSSSFSGIFTAGNKSKNLFQAQGTIDEKIGNNTEGTGQSLKLKISTTEFTVWGRTLNVAPLTTFITDPFAKTRFVASGVNGILYISQDSVKWEKITIAGASDFHGVAWGGDLLNRKFIVVGNTGKIYQSATGTNWTAAATVPTANNLYSVTWGGPDGGRKFVVVGQAGRIIYSGDADVWKDDTTGLGTADLKNICWGSYGLDGLFMAVGNDGNVLTSINGQSWEVKRTEAGQHLTAVTWGDNKFVAVGDRVVLVSLDGGSTWTSSGDLGTLNLKSITWGDGKFMAVGSGGTIYEVAFNNEVDPTIPSLVPVTSPVTLPLQGIAWGYNRFIAVGDTGTVLTRTDANWTKVTLTSGLTDNLLDIANADTGR